MGHDHGATAGARNRNRLIVVATITFVVLVAQLVGSAVTGSLALVADAAHMLTDVAGTLLAILAVTFAAKPATAQRTFGYYRLEILAAVVNAMLLFGVAAYIGWEAWQRWQSPPEVAGGLMLAFALVGLVANLAGMLILRADAKESLNVKGAYLEVVGDLLGSVAVIVAAIIITLTGWQRADVVASVAVALMIIPRTVSLLREAVDVLLEATPKGVDLVRVREHILDVAGVVGAHDLHAWTITSGMAVLSVHVVVADEVIDSGKTGPILDAVGRCLAEHFDLEHCTIQIEAPGHQEHEFATHA
ncbi:MAG: cation diffusion facilitator family transporter [Actinomycetales bacterium]